MLKAMFATFIRKFLTSYLINKGSDAISGRRDVLVPSTSTSAFRRTFLRELPSNQCFAGDWNIVTVKAKGISSVAYKMYLFDFVAIFLHLV